MTLNAFKIFSMVLPKKGPKVIPVTADLQAVQSVDIDLTENINNGFIDFVSTVFIDNSENGQELQITVIGGTGQIIKAAANTQGYYRILATNPPKFTVETTGAVAVPLQFLNTPELPAVWSTP